MPKLIYEIQPYAYLVAGAAMILSQHGLFIWMAGGALYTAGALCWVTRAQFRQRHGRRYPCLEYRDHPKASVNPIDSYSRTRSLPSALYELLPFGSMLAGLISYQVYLHQVPADRVPLYLLATATSLFFIAGLCIWTMRGYYRGYHQAHSPILND